MIGIVYFNFVLMLLLTLTLFAWVKVRYPESTVGKMLSTIA